MKGCMDLLAYNAKKTLDTYGRENFKGELRIEMEVTKTEHFDEANEKIWTMDVKQMMSLDVSEYFLKQYIERKMPVDTMVLKIGNDIIGRSMIPCAVQSTNK